MTLTEIRTTDSERLLERADYLDRILSAAPLFYLTKSAARSDARLRAERNWIVDELRARRPRTALVAKTEAEVR